MGLSDFTVSIVLVYLGFYVFIVFISLSIACGLYYLAGEPPAPPASLWAR